MKRILLALIGAAALVACGSSSDTLTGTPDPNRTAGGPDSTYNHSNDPAGSAADQPAAEPGQLKLVGSPEVTSRLHACGKLSYASIGDLLTSRGMTGAGTGRPNPSQNATQIYGGAQAALGVANYAGRVPEAPFASTSAMAKMFDIFSMGSYDVVSANFNAPGCPNVKVLGADGKFTKDGLSCLMGKPAKDEHLAIANDAIAKNPTDGAKIAIAALLSATHTCQ